MKKIITISVIALLFLTVPSFALAQSNQQGQGGQQQRVQNPTTHDDVTTASPQGSQQGQGMGQQVGAGNKGMGTAARGLNRVVERNNNPEVGEQIRSMVQNHVNVQARTKTALHQMSQRSRMLKFMIGPDYKNAGQVRNDVVGLRNDIRKLDQIKQNASPNDVEDIQDAIDDLQVETDGLDAQLAKDLSGFSLFGWLSKLLAN